MEAPLGWFDANASGLIRGRLDAAAADTETLLAHNPVSYTHLDVYKRQVAGGTHGFWRLALTGYIQWMMVNIGDLFFLDVWLIQKKVKNRFVLPGTEGHPGYEFKAWMKDYALPEHLLQWPLLLCPLMAAAQAGLCLLLQKI